MEKILINIALYLCRVLYVMPLRLLKFRKVKNYQNLLDVAIWEINILNKFGNVSMISAPLFSGGVGSFEKNLKILENYTGYLSSEGEIIWSQIPYLDLKLKRWSKIKVDTSKKIMHFYVPLIKSGTISKLICAGSIIPNLDFYKDSNGCKTERETAIKSGIEIEGRLCLWLHN